MCACSCHHHLWLLGFKKVALVVFDRGHSGERLLSWQPEWDQMQVSTGAAFLGSSWAGQEWQLLRMSLWKSSWVNPRLLDSSCFLRSWVLGRTAWGKEDTQCQSPCSDCQWCFLDINFLGYCKPWIGAELWNCWLAVVLKPGISSLLSRVLQSSEGSLNVERLKWSRK